MEMANRAHPPESLPPAFPLIGAHISTAGGLGQVPMRAQAIGAETVQVFSSNPRTWPVHPPDPELLAAFAASLGELRLPLFLHTIYLVNLASPDTELRRRSAQAVAHALVTGALAEAAAVVTHVGSHRGEGFARAVPGVEQAIDTALATATQDLAMLRPAGADRSLPRLLLETGAGSGATVGRSLEELEVLMAPFAAELGLCLDTAHLFAAGYPIHRAAGLETFVADLSQRELLNHVGLVHLNDSRVPFACNRDRHADPGQGELGYDSLARVVGHPALAHLSFILETPGPDGHGPGAAEIGLVKTMRAASPGRQEARPGGERGRGAPASPGPDGHRRRRASPPAPRA